MNLTRISAYLIPRLFLVDVGIAVGGTMSWLLHLDVRDWEKTALLCAVMFVVHVALWVLPLVTMLRPLEQWGRATREHSNDELLALDVCLETLPKRLALSYSLAWLSYFAAIALLGWFVFPEVLSFGRLEITSVGFQLSAVVVGAPLPVYALSVWLVSDIQDALGHELGERGLNLARTKVSLIPNLITLAVCLVLATAFWLLGTSWLAQGKGARDLAREQLSISLQWSAQLVAEDRAPRADSHELLAREQLPSILAPALATFAPEQPAAHGAVLSGHDPKTETYTVAAAVGDGRWLVAHAQVDFDRRTFWISTVIVLLSFLWWSSVSVMGTASMLTRPLVRLQTTLSRIVEVGDLRNLGRISVARADEIGRVSTELNRMLDVYEELAGAAQSVAEGDLRVTISGSGDLQDAFRTMVAHLAELVQQIHAATVEVATATAEIQATAQEQGRAAGRQSEGIREVSVSMERLADSAIHISSTATAVLDNAQRTRARADAASTALATLSEDIAHIAEHLEMIREVAKRSDLLALNGSLEATRAGEAGRGFALVANEMRRLAERVTGTLGNVRQAIASVEVSNAATVAATRDSHELAEATTEAAHTIATVTAAQTEDTERVSAGMRDIATLLDASEAAMTQTYASVTGLREQVGDLEALLRRFELDD